MLLLAAAETTSRNFANMMVLLFEHPEIMDKVRRDHSLSPKAVTEMMRFDPVASNLARVAARDTEVCSTIVPAGTAVTVSISTANRDPEANERPDELWLERPMRPVLSFGFGPHIHLSMHIARIEMEAALELLVDPSGCGGSGPAEAGDPGAAAARAGCDPCGLGWLRSWCWLVDGLVPVAVGGERRGG